MKYDGLKRLFVVAAAVGLTGCATSPTLEGTFNGATDSVSDFFGGIRDSVGMGDKTPKRTASGVWSNGLVTADVSKKGVCFVTSSQRTASLDTNNGIVSIMEGRPPPDGKFSPTFKVSPQGEVSVKQPNSAFKELPKMRETANVIDRAQKLAVSTAKQCELTGNLESQFTVANPDPQQEVTVNGVKVKNGQPEKPVAPKGKPATKPAASPK